MRCASPGKNRKCWIPAMLRQWWRRLADFYDEMYQAPYRRMAKRAQQRQEDLFRLMVMSETLGIPNPVSFYTLELMPFLLLTRCHEWPPSSER